MINGHTARRQQQQQLKAKAGVQQQQQTLQEISHADKVAVEAWTTVPASGRSHDGNCSRPSPTRWYSRALHQLTAEMAKARAEARQYAAVSERSLSTAWRLGQLGQLGLALLGDDAEDVGEDTAALALEDQSGHGEELQSVDTAGREPRQTEDHMF